MEGERTMISEYISYLAAQRSVEHLAGSALPNAPVEASRAIPASGRRFVAFRQWLSTDIRRLADWLEPPARRRTSVLTTAGRGR
jgi:hypothetical protein